MLIMSGVSNTCLFAPAPYYKLNKGFFLGFLFKPLGGLRPPRGLNKKASEKNPLSITYCEFSVYTVRIFMKCTHVCAAKQLINSLPNYK